MKEDRRKRLPGSLRERPPGADLDRAGSTEWWAMWGRDRLTDDFRATDWSDLLDTAVLHAALWSGRYPSRRRVTTTGREAGATKGNRARLRIAYAQHDSKNTRQALRT
jgi:hypothetical protein